MGIVRAGMRTLDLGTGTGTVARSPAQRGCESTGLDRSAPLMEQAQALDRARAEAGVWGRSGGLTSTTRLLQKDHAVESGAVGVKVPN
jgi:Methyltransferase domain